MSAPLARLRLGRSRRPTVALEPAESRLQQLTAELPEARAIERSDRDAPHTRVAGALTFEILSGDDLDD